VKKISGGHEWVVHKAGAVGGFNTGQGDFVRGMSQYGSHQAGHASTPAHTARQREADEAERRVNELSSRVEAEAARLKSLRDRQAQADAALRTTRAEQEEVR
jgi:hypothetical protein